MRHIRSKSAFLLGVLLVMGSLVPATSSRAQTNEDSARLIQLFVHGMRAYEDGNYDSYGRLMSDAMEYEPGHPAIMRHVARACARVGREDDALAWLGRVVDTGADLDIGEDENFASLSERERFRALLARVEALKQPLGRSELAFQLPAADLLPEGIAYDPVDGVFYLGSLRHRKIVKITSDGEISNFIEPGDDGFLGALGLRVDSKRRELWAATLHTPGMAGFVEEDNGKAAIYRYDLNAGQLVQSYPLDNIDGKHNLNDLVVSRAGVVYITDAVGGALYTIGPDDDELTVLVDPGTLYGPNGLVLSDDEKRLYISQYSIGLALMDMGTGEIGILPHPEDVVTAGIDGLYLYENTLVAIQNNLGMQRVTQFLVNAEGDSITGVRLIDSQDRRLEDPTTGALVDGDLFYIANSQLPKLGRDGSLPPPESFDDTYILKVRVAKAD